MIIFSIRYFVRQRRPDIFLHFGTAGTDRREISTRLCKTNSAIRSVSDLVGIGVVLSVILPETNGTNLPLGSFGYREVATARTRKIQRTLLSMA